MKNPFLAQPISFKPEAPVTTPFRSAQQVWDARLGTATAQARNWRMAFFCTCALLVIMGISLICLVNQQRVIPVMVGLDKQTGEPTIVGPVDEHNYQPGPMEVKFFLAQFIRYVRAVSLDPVVIKQNWLRAYSLLRPEAAGLLNEITQKDPNSPLAKIGKVLVSVQPLSILHYGFTLVFSIFVSLLLNLLGALKPRVSSQLRSFRHDIASSLQILTNARFKAGRHVLLNRGKASVLGQCVC